ncbi:unnamed protein product [Rotaria sp. Silwood1]|nr:unnamed protein product [Rotaria sp. Silwood1]CAF1638927.1 unnamed protein product [Rotaria sp. Silwood1]
MIYFQLEDLPNNVKSMLKSIDLLTMCHPAHLSAKSNREKSFDSIVEDLNALQTNELYIPALGGRLDFAFSIVAGDHLASNDIGGFQKSFSNGQFCRHRHINYDQRFIHLSEISYVQRTKDQHDNLVQQVLRLNNNDVIGDVIDKSPLSELIGFHAVVLLPNDVMHDLHEGLCGQLLLAMFKESSTKRFLSYAEIEDRLISFEHDSYDKKNKPPFLRKKHLHKGKIIGTASQQMCLF